MSLCSDSAMSGGARPGLRLTGRRGNALPGLVVEKLFPRYLARAMATLEHGVVVVTAAGNYGPFNGTIMSPGDDPLAITVGSVDDQASVDPSGDSMATFSGVGSGNGRVGFSLLMMGAPP